MSRRRGGEGESSTAGDLSLYIQQLRREVLALKSQLQHSRREREYTPGRGGGVVHSGGPQSVHPAAEEGGTGTEESAAALTAGT